MVSARADSEQRVASSEQRAGSGEAVSTQIDDSSSRAIDSRPSFTVHRSPFTYARFDSWPFRPLSPLSLSLRAAGRLRGTASGLKQKGEKGA